MATEFPVVEYDSKFFKKEGCFHPVVIRDKKSGEWMKVPCGSCLDCLRRRQAQWVTRLVEELRQNPETSYFVTLTYRPSEIPCDDYTGLMQVKKKDIMKLNADLRSRFQKGYFYCNELSDLGRIREKITLPFISFKFYLTSEYGPTGGNPHYHSVYYGLPEDRYLVELLFQNVWRKGFVQVYKATPETVGYITKYLVNSKACDTFDERFQARPFSLMSKGLGKSYVKRMADYHAADPVGRSSCVYHGEHSVMPRYYRYKMYTEEQRERYAKAVKSSRKFLEEVTYSMSTDELIAFNKARKHYQDSQMHAAELIAKKKHKL